MSKTANFPEKPKIVFYEQCVTYTNSRFYLDEDIGEPQYYRPLIQCLTEAEDGDTVELWVNSGGGSLLTTEAIIAAIWSSKAEVIAVVNGAAYSGAGMIVLQCDKQIIMPTATFMAHQASYGSYGGTNDIVSQAEFMKVRMKELLETVYENFLTPEEIIDLMTGKTFWMTAKEIEERLIAGAALAAAAAEAEALLEEEDSTGNSN
jgi:ATP-dependent protease ClpP protease subunit